jgi:hypothetical protein
MEVGQGPNWVCSAKEKKNVGKHPPDYMASHHLHNHRRDNFKSNIVENPRQHKGCFLN